MDYRIIALDLDGTLTNSEKKISEPTLKALLHIQEKGYKVVLASGRPTPGISKLAQKLKLADYGGYVLSYNGGKIIECSTNRILYQKILPGYIVPEVFAFAKANGVGLITYTSDCIITGTATDRYMETESRICGLPIKTVPDFEKYIDFDINKCLLTGEPDYLASVEVKLRELYGKSFNVYRSEPFFIEFMPHGIDKAHSLNLLLSEIGLTPEQLICCGDGWNDVSMIEFAGLGVAMANAQECVKSVANYITASNDEDGILHVIEKFILKKAMAF